MINNKKNKKPKPSFHLELENKIYGILKHNPQRTFKPNGIASRLKLKKGKKAIESSFESLVRKGKVAKISSGEYKYMGNTDIDNNPIHKSVYTGRIDIIKSGAGYVRTDDDMEDIYVAKKRLKTAMHNDLVEVILEKWRRRPEGRVTKILKRARDKYVGIYKTFGNQSVAIVNFQTQELEINIVGEKKAQEGDRVIVKITKYGANNLKGEILQILISNKPHDLEMSSILINAGFDITFDEKVLGEASSLSNKISQNDIVQRLDIRDVTTFTIDPSDAKDFDDALSYRSMDNGEVEVGIHIADVDHFVKENSEIDKEAQQRSTSVYLVDRVCPMLPERLSNDLCSLRPNEDKFTFSTIFRFDKNGKIVKKWFGKTIMHSNRRFTYEEAQEIIENGEGDFHQELLMLNKIAIKLRNDRYKNGSIKFETDEVRFTLNENNEPVGIFIKERKEAHLLVEDFMLLANKEVAAYIYNRKKAQEIPFVYRIHDEPDPEKLQDFALLAQDFGLKFNLNTPKEIARSFNEMEEKLDNPEELRILMPLAIRTMAKAEYSTGNIGHYGLSFSTYSHFTSPIRRYADLLTHRILFQNLEKEFRVNKVSLEEKCQHISRQERRAIGAERESIKYMQIIYMQDKLGNVFDARISGIIEKGIFVEVIESKAEGLIPFQKIGRLQGIYPGMALVKTGEGEKQFRFGDSLRVKLVNINIDRRHLDFHIMNGQVQ